MNKQTPPSLEKVIATASRAKQACLHMKQAGDLLEKSLIDLENQARQQQSQRLSLPHDSV